MKKLLVFCLCTVFLFLTAGCRSATEQTVAETAVDTQLVEMIGKPKDEAVKALALSEDMNKEQAGVYVKEMLWCGLLMETEIGFYEDALSAAIAKATFADDADFAELGHSCLDALEKQFHAPYGYMELDLTTGSTVSTDVIADRDTAFSLLAETENGGFGYRYSLSGENDGTGDNGPYVEICFTRYAQEPDRIRVTIAVQTLQFR